jgi:hypothetical protein
MSEKKKQGNPAFYKGMKSINPTGRPKGSVNKFSALARELMSSRSEEIVQVVIDKALGGCPQALRLCMDRILPVHKAIDPNRAKQDAQVIINVASIESIEHKIEETPVDLLIDQEDE